MSKKIPRQVSQDGELSSPTTTIVTFAAILAALILKALSGGLSINIFVF